MSRRATFIRALCPVLSRRSTQALASVTVAQALAPVAVALVLVSTALVPAAAMAGASTLPAAISGEPLLARYHGPQYLLAGNGAANFKDGHFLEAGFDHPAGLAVSADGTQLYVADRGNHAVRAVGLGPLQQVSTVAGLGRPGFSDGPVATALLREPLALAASSDGQRLYLLDQGGEALRVLDLQAGVVGTLARALTGSAGADAAWCSLALDPTTERLYLWRRGGGLDRLRAPTGALEPLSTAGPTFDGPGQLAWAEGLLCLFRPSAGALYRLPISEAPTVAPTAGPAPIAASAAANAGAGSTLAGSAALASPAISASFRSEPLSLSLSGATGLYSLGQVASDRYAVGLYDPAARLWRRFSPSTGRSTSVPLRDGLGRWISAPQPGADWHPNTLVAQRSPFTGELWAAASAANGEVYVAEPKGHRLLASPLRLGWNDLWEQHLSGEEVAKPAGVKRVLVVGSSNSFLVNSGVGADPELVLPGRLQAWLNLLGALQGKPWRYDVRLHAETLSLMGSPATYLLQAEASLDKAHLDAVVVDLMPIDVLNELIAFGHFKTHDDITAAPFDAQEALRDWSERAKELGPLQKELLAYLKTKPARVSDFWGVDKEGKLLIKEEYNLELLRDPKILSLAVRVMEKAFHQAAALAKRHHLKVIVNLYPLAAQLSPAEMAGGGRFISAETMGDPLHAPLAAAAARQGLSLIDLVPEAQLLDPVHGPLVTQDDHHYNLQGHEWMGFLLARKLLGKLE